MTQKRILAVHDISCFGRCSLTIALPVLSAAGMQVSVIPTAVLSTHTGGFTGYTYRDLTADILPIADHWQGLGLAFDAIYTGYLGSKQQLAMVDELARRFKKKGVIMLIDPVMADHGRLYANFAADFPAGMRGLCVSCADIITPNITEALLMLDRPYREGPYTRAFIADILKKLAEMGESLRQIVLTGIHLETDDAYGAAAYDRPSGAVHFAMARRVPGIYHGTGDLFASVLLAALCKGRPLAQAADTAVDFTAKSIARTHQTGADARFGVDFEAGLAGLGEI